MDEWKAAYERALGATVSTIAWCPIWCDTSDLVANLDKSSLSFSGGALIVCETGVSVFLTWTQRGRQFCLSPSKRYEDCWLPDALDRISCSCDDPWNMARHTLLSQVSLFADGCDENRLIVAARHELVSEDRTLILWIGTGDHHGVGDHDDLWVAVDIDPINLSSLVEVGSFGI